MNEYLTDARAGIPILKLDPEGEKRHLARLKKHKGESDASKHASALSALEQASGGKREKTMPYLIAAVNAGATVGEVCNLWRRVCGEYKEMVVV